MFSKRLATAQLQMLSEASAQSETGLWIPEYRTKAIMAVINPKQLESGTLSSDHPRHFNQNTPIVFER